LESFSAHADENELLNYCSNFDKSILKQVFLVHGEKDQQDIFKNNLNSAGFKDVIIPSKGYEETLS